MMPRARAVLVVAFALLLPQAARAQNPAWDPLARYATRESLQALLQRFQRAADSPAYSPALRAQAAREADKIRNRLATGDFQTGDRIALIVEGERELSDTFSVSPGPSLTLPTAGDLSLSGVLRSELESHLATQLARFIRNPKVRTRTLVRISIDGGVAQPGFYTLSSELILSDALNIAGGMGRDANIREVVIQRGTTELWDSEAVQQAIADGRTLDELGVRAGDRIVVGERSSSGGIGAFGNTARSVTLILALPASIVGLLALIR